MNKAMHVAVPGSRRVVMPGAKALGPANPHATLELLVKLRRKKEIPELTGRPAQALSRDQLNATYGASADDVQKAVTTLQGLGLQVVKTDPATRSIDVSGTVHQIENAFQVKLFDYAHTGGNYRGRVGDIYVPAALEGIVTGVFGMDDRRVARRGVHYTNHAALARHVSSVPPSWYLPGELGKRYNFPQGDGTGQTVALLEFGGGYFPADLTAFCTQAQIPVPKVVPISVDGTPTGAKDGTEGEVMLDIEVVAGVCPKATIAVYFARFTERGWIRALDAVVQDATHNPGVLSVSWGFAEKAYIWTEQGMTQVNESLKEAALIGMTVCVSAGDDGSSDAVSDGLAHVDFPASSPYVLAVGGTTIPSKSAPLPDISWFEGNGLRQQNNPNSGSTGGGTSAVFEQPSWQKTIAVTPVNPGAIVGRCIPDLAANADWTASPYLLVVDGNGQPNGGTSAASPLMAAMIALINARRDANNRVGYLTPLLYQIDGGSPVGAKVCTDVVKGNNITDQVGGYSAGPGYDAVSGWGTPDGTKLMQVLSAVAPAPAPGAAVS
jgi:kumamolisin